MYVIAAIIAMHLGALALFSLVYFLFLHPTKRKTHAEEIAECLKIKPKETKAMLEIMAVARKNREEDIRNGCWTHHHCQSLLSGRGQVDQQHLDHIENCKDCKRMLLATYPDAKTLNELLGKEVYKQ